MEHGIGLATDRGPVASIGIDTWGVDYGLVDRTGRLVGPPFSYRDDRTSGFRDVLTRIGAERLFDISGLQPHAFNTVFQLAVHRQDEVVRASRLLMLPELLVYHLTGEMVGEYSSAGTTGLLDLDRRCWSDEVCSAAGIDMSVLPPLLPATTRVGTWRGVPVHLVGGHDTASAVVAMGAGASADTAFVSAGTWLLVGREQDHADRSPAARRAFSNEIGALGGIRLLRNVSGFWVVDHCAAAWGTRRVPDLMSAAATSPLSGQVVDLTDARFVNPANMVAEYTAAARLPIGTDPAVVTRSIVESMAWTCARVIADLDRPGDIALFGGGARSTLLAERLEAHTGLPVTVGPVEATALGNALVQGVAIGRFADLDDARGSLRAEPF